MFNQNQQYQDNFMNAIDILALLIGIQNLSENRQQSAQNDVHSANQEQAEMLLSALGKRLDEQDSMLKEILTLLKEEGTP